MSVSSAWTFTPYPSLPTTFLPNVAIFNATNPLLDNLTYQITLSYPFEWGSSSSPSSLPANLTSPNTLTLYVTDGNALALTAAENLKRRRPVDSSQPDTLVVSIGYPFTDRVYDSSRRGYDFRPPYPTDLLGPEPPNTPPSGADEFIQFINETLRPWVRTKLFPRGINFTRDALYGHSFGGLFVIYALTQDPDLFDTFISASPGLYLYNASILNIVSRKLGRGHSILSGSLAQTTEVVTSLDLAQQQSGISSNTSTTTAGNNHAAKTKKEKQPAVFIGYGSTEQFPKRRRTGETEAQFWEKRNFLAPFKMTDYVHDLYDLLVGAGKLRDVVLKAYDDQDHAAVGASALGDGISYFADWPS